MNDWKARIDAWEAEQRRKLEVREPRRAEAARRRRGQVQTLAVHQQRFRCHICHQPSAGPVTEYMEQPHSEEFVAYYGRLYGWHTRRRRGSREAALRVRWDRPTGLLRCSRCRAWTCEADLYKTICPNCAAKLPLRAERAGLD